jgi:hypothetical protein
MMHGPHNLPPTGDMREMFEGLTLFDRSARDPTVTED